MEFLGGTDDDDVCSVGGDSNTVVRTIDFDGIIGSCECDVPHVAGGECVPILEEVVGVSIGGVRYSCRAGIGVGRVVVRERVVAGSKEGR